LGSGLLSHLRGCLSLCVNQKGAPNFADNMPSPKGKRYRPSTSALDGARQYKRATPKADTTTVAPRNAGGRGRGRTVASSNSRSGRFIRRHGSGRLATHACEVTLMYLVEAFAAEVGKAAAGEAAERAAGGSNTSTEEGDVRKALARLTGAVPPAPAGKRKPTPLHPALLGAPSATVQ
jgi:hypothetical protein